jgi:hypothetical protein
MEAESKRRDFCTSRVTLLWPPLQVGQGQGGAAVGRKGGDFEDFRSPISGGGTREGERFWLAEMGPLKIWKVEGGAADVGLWGRKERDGIMIWKGGGIAEKSS